MSGLSGFGESLVLSALTPSFYVSLHSADPGNTGLNEITFGGYQRFGTVAFSTVNSPNPTVMGNTSVLSFSPATAGWGLVSFFGVWDALSGGNFRGSAPLATPITVNSADSVRFPVGALTISVN